MVKCILSVFYHNWRVNFIVCGLYINFKLTYMRKRRKHRNETSLGSPKGCEEVHFRLLTEGFFLMYSSWPLNSTGLNGVDPLIYGLWGFFPNKYVLHTTDSWLNANMELETLMANCEVIPGFLTLQGVSAPNLHIVQGSTASRFCIPLPSVHEWAPSTSSLLFILSQSRFEISWSSLVLILTSDPTKGFTSIS